MNMKHFCTFLYAAFAASMVMQLFPSTMLPGLIALVITIALTYTRRPAAAGTVWESHFTWLVRTFWIGGIYLFVLTVLGMVALYLSLDMNALMEAVSSGQVGSGAQMAGFLIGSQGLAVYAATFGMTALFTVWWLLRCWHGFTALREEKDVPDMMRWF